MSEPGFPRTTVGGVSLSRMIVGTNWMLGYSHTSNAADAFIVRTSGSPAAIAATVGAFLERGVDAVMGLFSAHPELGDGVKMAEDRVGRPVVRIDTPIIDVADSPEARRSAAAVLDRCRAAGAVFCLPHHTSVEQLVEKGRQRIHRLPDYLAMIRDRGMVPGLSAHMPELVVYSDANGYDVETYVQISNCTGYLMQVEVEYIHRVIWNARRPRIEGRSSPKKTEIMR